MARPKDPNSKQSIADRKTAELGFPVDIDMVKRWIRKGWPMDDNPALLKLINNQERLPSGMSPMPLAFIESARPAAEMKPEDVEAELAELRSQLIASGDLKTAQTIKVKISGLREVLKELREQGKYILREVATAAGMKAGLASRGAWERIEDDLPPMLDGLTAAQMKSKLRDYARSQCLELADHFAT